MKMLSTRGIAPAVSASEAIAAGPAPDGGLYMPESFPTFQPHDFASDATLADIAHRLLLPFFEGDVLAAALVRHLPQRVRGRAAAACLRR